MSCKFQISCFSYIMLVASILVAGQNVNNADLKEETGADEFLEFKIDPLPDKLDFFPVMTQFSPVPSGKGWKGEEGPLSEKILRETIDNIIEHGFTGIDANTYRPDKEEAFILAYAQSRGMFVASHVGSLEGFGRTAPPSPSVYSPEYPIAVRSRAVKAFERFQDIPRLYNAFTYMDEPFHWGKDSFGHSEDVRAEFKKRYGYDLPPDLKSIQDDPKKWLDVINFHSDNFAHGWRQVYRIIKEEYPGFKVVLTHDSHNTFGGGCGSHADLAIDDVFHWGGDFADLYIFDIYPYLSIDFRFGQCGKIQKPRISQLHYTFAQMRNLTSTYQKELGYWFGTCTDKSGWYKGFIGEKVRAKYWTEHEMSATAVAQGADFLITGKYIPDDAKHWESLGEGLRLIQKTKGKLLQVPKVKAKACMLFPRTQYIQLQEEYFNVGLSFELFLRAFGELDILHEEQVTDEKLNGYEILLLFDVKLLPEKVAEHIASFVHNGGLLITDCVPHLDTYKKPMHVMEELLGIENAQTDRIQRRGHWITYATQEPVWQMRPEDAPDESVFNVDNLSGQVLGQPMDLLLISPRPCRVTTGEVLAQTKSGQPGIIYREAGKGQIFSLGFCLQDTYFKTWQDNNESARTQLRKMFRTMTQKAGIHAHVYSSNPEIEASIRANKEEGFLFIINHESEKSGTTVELADLGFEINQMIDLSDDLPVVFQKTEYGAKLHCVVKKGETKIFHLDAQEGLLTKLSANLQSVLQKTKPLEFSRGNRLPLYVWPIIGQLRNLNDSEAEQVIKLLDQRGIAMSVSWNPGNNEALTEGVRVGAIQQKLGLPVNINATSCLHSFFNGDEKTFHIDAQGNSFFDDSFGGRKMGCPFALKFRYPIIQEQLEYYLQGYQEKNIDIDFIFADWEVDGPIEWNDAWANSRKCVRCRENIKDIGDFQEFQKALRVVRSDIQKTVYADTVHSYFPRAMVGNYAVYPHDGYRYWYDYFEKPFTSALCKTFQKASYRPWFHEFDLTDYTVALPTVYTWYDLFNWYEFENPDYRWFYNMLSVASNAARHTKPNIPIISFVHWHTTAPPGNPDSLVKQFSEEMYKELLWHMLLRGHDSFFLWCIPKELSAEIPLVHEVYAEALQFRDFLDKGRPISFDVPDQPGSVISGLIWNDEVLIRRTDFTQSLDTIKLNVEDKILEIPRCEARCQIIKINEK
ncbi:MAG: hypothetical protein J7K65_08990 [Planctomycetes bacterium]|nr:hypothetical protein [Planctomycetota bacterium]